MSSLLLTLRSKNIDLGVHYIHGDVINIAHEINRDKEYNTPELEIGQATNNSIFSQFAFYHFQIIRTTPSSPSGLT